MWNLLNDHLHQKYTTIEEAMVFPYSASIPFFSGTTTQISLKITLSIPGVGGDWLKSLTHVVCSSQTLQHMIQRKSINVKHGNSSLSSKRWPLDSEVIKLISSYAAGAVEICWDLCLQKGKQRWRIQEITYYPSLSLSYLIS